MIQRMFVLGALLGCSAACVAAELTVGPGNQFARIEPAVAAARPGDTILVYPQADNRPYERPAINITTARLTLRAVISGGQRVPLRGDGFVYSGAGNTPRAIVQFNKGADGCVLEGFELSGAHNGSQNGAGVRINQANDVAVRNCHIHDNDMGIMSNGDGTPRSAVNQLIECCLIHSNGNRENPGYNHNLYLGGTSVRLIGCEIHSSLTGHNLKSRAHHTIVLGCYIHDSSNRELDLVDAKGDTTAPASHAAIVGCVIAKSPKCPGNRGVIHFGQDGGNEHDGTVFLAHNTIVTPFIGAVVTLSAPKARAAFYNNIVWDGGSFQAGQRLLDATRHEEPQDVVAGQCNWLSSGFAGGAVAGLQLKNTTLGARGQNPPFADAQKGDYRLVRRELTVVDAGVHLPADLMKLVGDQLVQFQAPLGRAPRRVSGKPDLGAYEIVAP